MHTLSLLLPFALLHFLHPSKSELAIELSNAISQGIIKATPISTGTYAESSVTLKLVNKVNRNITIHIPAGTLYHPENSDDQSLIQLEEQDVIVSAGGTIQLNIDAYCTESNDGVPDGGSTFQIGKTTDKDLLALIVQLKKTPTDKSAYQDAVWSITDGHELTYLPNQTESDQQLRTFIANTTGQENNWYNLTPVRRIDADRRIIIEPTIISGMIEFACTPGKSIIEEVRKKDGTVMISNDTNFAPRRDHVTYEFKLKIRGWDKGEYYVLLKNSVKDLARFDFTL